MDGDPFGLIGIVLDERFRVDAIVGEGQLSVIYKGFHLGADKPVAIKCLHLPDTLDPALTRPVVEAFEDAGRLHDRLGRGNPHLVQTIASGQTVAPRTGAAVPYRVREWFEGESLGSDLARRRRQGDKPRTVEEAFALLSPAIDGIARAHEEGIAHLSLDPGNLFLARHEGSCSLKVLDFGTARASRSDGRPTLDSEVTRGLRLLHPAYAAPEQLDMDLGEPGPWSDVYALALVLMEVLAQRSEMDRGDTAALVKRALDKQKRPTPKAHGLSLSPTLDLVLTRAVARSPESRQKSARVFLNELKAAVRRQGVAVRASRAAPRIVASSAPPKPVKPPPPPKVTPEAAPLPPSAAVSGPIAASSTDDLQPTHVESTPSGFQLPALADPELRGARENFIRRRLASQLVLLTGAAALALTVIVVWVFARRPRETSRAPSPAHVLSVASAVVPSAAPPVAPAAAAPAAPVAMAPAAPDVTMAHAANPHSEARAAMVRFSWTDAQHAIHFVSRKVERCRRGPFWGNGYATVAFWNDGSVHRVLVDPPFSMTSAGKCVADALRTAHMPSFAGRVGYYRFRFHIAPR